MIRISTIGLNGSRWIGSQPGPRHVFPPSHDHTPLACLHHNATTPSLKVAAVLSNFPRIHWGILGLLASAITFLFLTESNQEVLQFLNSLQVSVVALVMGCGHNRSITAPHHPLATPYHTTPHHTILPHTTTSVEVFVLDHRRGVLLHRGPLLRPLRSVQRILLHHERRAAAQRLVQHVESRYTRGDATRGRTNQRPMMKLQHDSKIIRLKPQRPCHPSPSTFHPPARLPKRWMRATARGGGG